MVPHGREVGLEFVGRDHYLVRTLGLWREHALFVSGLYRGQRGKRPREIVSRSVLDHTAVVHLQGCKCTVTY